MPILRSYESSHKTEDTKLTKSNEGGSRQGLQRENSSSFDSDAQISFNSRTIDKPKVKTNLDAMGEPNSSIQ